MGAIDLLFDAKRGSERLHQLALRALITRSQVLTLLLGEDLPPETQVKDCQWEPKGRLYDLAVSLGERGRLFIELKVDNALDQGQIRSQLRPLLSPAHGKDRVLYLLLGHAAITSPLSRIAAVAKQELKDAAGRCLVRTASDLVAALESPQLFSGTMAPPPEAGELATTHRQQLLRLTSRSSLFFDKPLSNWGAGDYLGFFAHCRQQISGMEDAGIGYVPTPNGSFIGCWWSTAKVATGVDVFLQLSQDLQSPGCLFCIRIAVKGKEQRREWRRRAGSFSRRCQRPRHSRCSLPSAWAPARP